MNQSQYNQLFSFIWNIATDVLVYAFDKGEYKKIIMPMLVLRRIDVLLEPTKNDVLKKKELLDKEGFKNQDELLFQVTGYPFYNTSNFIMKTLKSETDPQRLKMNFLDYLNGYSSDVRDIIDRFHLRQMVDRLTEVERLGSIIDKFTDDKINLSNKPILDDEDNELQPPLDNHTMGTIFEELLRKFNEENNVTEAGEHFTPRDYVKLLADLAVLPIADQITDNTYEIYDGACGTGGILTIAKERIEEIGCKSNKHVNVNIFGQELTPETYATCKADLMISGQIGSFHYQHGAELRDNIAFDSTISRDGHSGKTFDFCISNPPFGTPWKEDLNKWGLSQNGKKNRTVNDVRFYTEGDTDEGLSFLPDIGDTQMMFLANNLSRMREDTALGTRIVEVHNGSSLFSGDAGSGPSNLRQYIIEHDLLEAIVAMPEKDFYNTGIGTYIWIVTNRKEERRKGYVQLIDATEIKTPLRKNLGEKNCETSETDRAQILKLLTEFKPTPQSKILPNGEFGYWSVKTYQPQRDEQGNILHGKDGKPLIDKKSREIEIIPFLYQGGVDSFFQNEILPYQPDTIIDRDSIETGYRLSFTNYFSKHQQGKDTKLIADSIRDIEMRAKALSDELFGLREEVDEAVIKGLNSNVKMKDSGVKWIGLIPEHWTLRRIKNILTELKEKSENGLETPLSLSKEAGLIPFSEKKNKTMQSSSYIGGKIVHPGEIVFNRFKARLFAISKYKGIVSNDYAVYQCRATASAEYMVRLFSTTMYREVFNRKASGIGDGFSRLYTKDLFSIYAIFPPLSEQLAIVSYIDDRCRKIDTLIAELTSEIEKLNDYKLQLIADAVTGRMNEAE